MVRKNSIPGRNGVDPVTCRLCGPAGHVVEFHEFAEIYLRRIPRCVGFPALEPVHGEFLLRPRLAFGIAHDNVSASDTISNLRPWIPSFRSEFVLSAQRERGICCSSL